MISDKCFSSIFYEGNLNLKLILSDKVKYYFSAFFLKKWKWEKNRLILFLRFNKNRQGATIKLILNMSTK